MKQANQESKILAVLMILAAKQAKYPEPENSQNQQENEVPKTEITP